MAKKKAKVGAKRRGKKSGTSFGRTCCGNTYTARPPKKKKKAASFTTKSCRGRKKKKKK